MRFIPDIGPVQETVSDIFVPDATDRKLLLALASDARASIAKLSKECRANRDTVAYRLQRFDENKILAGTRALIDVGKLGYDAYHIFLKLRNPTPTAEHKMVEAISKLPFVRAVLKFFGKYDYEIAIVAKSVVEFDERLTQIIEHAGVALQSYEVLVITQSFVARSFPQSFGIASVASNAISKVASKKKSDSQMLDSIDLALLAAIADDARATMVSISQKTKVPIDTLIYRLHKLQDWLILGYSPVVNYAALGYSLYAVMLDIAQLDKAKESMIKEFLRSLKHILWAVKTVGASNVLIYVCVRREQEYHETIAALRNAFPEQIRGFESLSAVAQFKYTLAPQIMFNSDNIVAQNKSKQKNSNA